MAFEKGLNYNSPNKVPSTIDASAKNEQMHTFVYLKKAIIDSRKEQYFVPLATSLDMPKHMGKSVRCHYYVPLLDDRNKNDQGIDANGAVIADGNLYGSSKDIGTITDKLPRLTENGGRVNRVGFTRVTREGSIFELGFFREFTEDAYNFDSDEKLHHHLSRELVNGAVKIVEDILQRDLLNSAGVTIFPGTALDLKDVTGEGATPTIVDYDSLYRMDQVLNDNRSPMATTIITGSNLTDTRTVDACRIAYVGSEVLPLLEKMRDPFNERAWIPIQQYAGATKPLHGEVGSIGNFRFIRVPEMLHHGGKGASVTTNPGYRATKGKYDVFPILVVGDDSFSTIGFQTDGVKLNFNVITKMPGSERANRNDPYGKTGFSSIRFYYGFLCKRPERIAVLWTVAPI